MVKPIDEMLHALACELRAIGACDSDDKVIARLELPRETYFRLLGHMALKMVRDERRVPNETLGLEIVCDSGQVLVVHPSAR